MQEVSLNERALKDTQEVPKEKIRSRGVPVRHEDNEERNKVRGDKREGSCRWGWEVGRFRGGGGGNPYKGGEEI